MINDFFWYGSHVKYDWLSGTTHSSGHVEEAILITYIPIIIMRGRIASMAIGAGVARRRAGAQAEQGQQQAQQAQQAQIKAQQDEIQALQQQKQPQPPQSSNQEDVTQKLQKLADLKQKGVITDEEFQKLKMEAISKL